MGVDASIYALNSKKRYYFDRLYNIESHKDNYEAVDFEESERIYELLLRRNKSLGCSAAEVFKLTQACKREWLKQPADQHYHALWLAGIERFVSHCGDDIYFVIADNDDWDKIKAYEHYAEFETEELIS